MSTTHFPLLGERESLKVLHWRYDSLVRAGYSEQQALTLAAEIDADLHLAIELVQRGCPPETAIRILL